MNSVSPANQNLYLKNILTMLVLVMILFLISVIGNSAINATSFFNPSKGARAENKLNGHYKGTLVITAPVNIGVVDLTIQLTSTQGSSTGYALDSATSHFTQNPAVNASITEGKSSTPHFIIQSASFVEVIAGQTITRSFSIDGQVLGDGTILTGSYAETIIGYTKEPLRIAGNVLLSKSQVGVAQIPSTPTPEVPGDGDFEIFLPLVNASLDSVSATASSSKISSEPKPSSIYQHKVYLPLIYEQANRAQLTGASLELTSTLKSEVHSYLPLISRE